MSKKIFSAQEWENAPSKQKASLPALPPHNKLFPIDLATDIDRVVNEIEAIGVDIAPDYGMWVNVGFALADALGEQGREVFHRISRLHPDYVPVNTDKQYTHCLNGRGSGVTIATFFHYAAQAGVELHHTSNTILPNCQNGKTAKWIKQESELPNFPEEIFDALPPFLQKTVGNAISIEDRDAILLGAIGCLSVCFYNVCGVYDERVVYSNLYLFVVADAGMGKGTLTLCRELIAPINQRLHEQTAQWMTEYKRELAEYQKCKGKNPEAVEPVAPPQKTLIIPANSSASSLISILHDCEGIGLLFETEGDTLSQTLKSEHGNYSDLLRKAYHHETISMSRRKDREYLELTTRVSLSSWLVRPNRFVISYPMRRTDCSVDSYSISFPFIEEYAMSLQPTTLLVRNMQYSRFWVTSTYTCSIISLIKVLMSLYCQFIFNRDLLSGLQDSTTSAVMRLTMVCKVSSAGWDLLHFA